MEFMIDDTIAKLDLQNHLLYIDGEAYSLPDNKSYKAKKIYLKITDDCNLNCTYCFQNKDKKGDVKDWDIYDYKNIIDLLKKEDDAIFVLFGGEPLLDENLEKIKSLMDEFDAEDRQFDLEHRKFLIYTNGNYSPLIASFLHDNKEKILPVITIDGCENDHNSRRINPQGNSYRNIIENCKGLVQESIPFYIQVNIDRKNISNIEGLLIEIDELLNSPTGVVLNKVLREEDSITEQELLALYLSLQKKNFRNYLSVNSNVLWNVTSIFSRKQLEVERCSVGNTKVIDFSSHTIYACPQCASTQIGYFDKDHIVLNDEKVAEYVQTCGKNADPECLTCDLKYICSEGCVLVNKQDDCRANATDILKIILENSSIFFNQLEIKNSLAN